MAVIPFRKRKASRARSSFRRGLRPLGLRDFALTIGMFAVLGALAWQFEDRAAFEIVSSMRVIDGDTIDSREGRIRLDGIDAPESDQTCDNGFAIYACGREATERLRQLISGREIACTARRKDRYGRFLATCHADGVNLNAAMVEAGWAVASGDYELAEMRARSDRRGLWAGDFDRPRDWRVMHGMATEDAGLFDAVLDRLRLAADRW